MGYRGQARGLDPQINLTYAVPFLANAWLADGNEDRATALFRGGYYDVAKHKKMQHRPIPTVPAEQGRVSRTDGNLASEKRPCGSALRHCA